MRHPLRSTVRSWLLAIGMASVRAAGGSESFVEFQIPTSGSGPRDIAAGPDGGLWFSETSTNKIGRVTQTGVFAEYPLPSAGSTPLGIVSGPDGNLWFAEIDGNRIGRLAPSGALQEFTLPTSGSGPRGIASGPDGNLWFTERDGNKIGRITPGGSITEFPIPTAGSQPFGITSGPDGNLWFAEVNANQIGRIAASPPHEIREFPVPTSGSRPTFIAAGPDGNLWFTEVTGNKIGRITPSGAVSELPVPTAGSGPRDIALGPDGSLWFAGHDANKIGRLTPSGSFTELTLPTAGSNPFGITTGPDGNIWFTEMTGGRIGVLLLGQTTLTIPASASIHGAASTFFQTDLWVMNRSSSQATTVTALYQCFAGQSCGSGARRFALSPRESRLFSDCVGTLFSAPGTAGAIELSYDQTRGGLTATSRTYTPSLPAPTLGTSIPALASADARRRTLFVGLGSNGGDLRSGFRSNAGAYNPGEVPVQITFSVYGGDGALLGSIVRSWAPREAYQISDIFAAAGAGPVVTTNAYLVAVSDGPVFAYVTVIDNQSGDSIFALPSNDEAP